MNGFSGQVPISFEGLPPGVHAFPSSSLTLAAGQSQQVTLTAEASAPAGGATVTIRGISGTLNHTYLFGVQVYSTPTFNISVTPATLSLTPASTGTLQISTTATSGTFLRMYTDYGLLNGCAVDFDYRDFGTTSNNPGKLSVRASAVAQPLQNVPIVITATNDATNQTSVAIVTLSVTVPYPQVTTPTRSTFVRTDEKPSAAVYDARRKLVFVTLQNTNQVRVLSSTDGHLVATIPVEQPIGIDETPDGTEVLVGGYSPNVAVIDPDLLQVTRLVPAPRVSTPGVTVDFLFPEQVVALSTGNALILGKHGYTSETYLYLWNRTTGQMKLYDIPGFVYPQSIQPTPDHSTVLVSSADSAGSTISIYSTLSNAFSTAIHIVDARFPVLHPNGRHFAAFQGQSGLVLYDSGGNTLQSIAVRAFPWGGLIFSLDGRRLYAFASFGLTQSEEVAVLDAQNFTLLGLVPDVIQQSGSSTTPLAIDETEIIFGASLRGVAFLDVQSPGALALPLPGQFTVVPELVSQSVPVAVKLNTSGSFDQAKNYSIFVGAPPASPDTIIGTNISDPSSYAIQMLVPPSPRAGPANVTLVHSDGWFEVQPEAVSYGPSIITIGPNAGTTAGGTQLTILGYGLDAVGVQVMIGGQLAKILQVSPAVFQGYYAPFMFSSLEVLSPPGTVGFADVAVITPHGSTTVRAGYQYLDFAQVFPREGALDDMVYDRQRQRLYISNEDHNRVEIFDLGLQTYLAPIAVGNSPTGVALTPDGQLLAVLNHDDNTVSIISLDQMRVISTKTALTPSDQQSSCLGRVFLISPAGGHRMLIDVDCTYLLVSGRLHLLDLDSGSLSCSGVAGCDASGERIPFATGLAAMASSPDGSKIFLADLNPVGGPVGLLDFKANTFTTERINGISGDYNDATMDGDGNWFVAGFFGFESSVLPVSIYTSVSYADAGPRSFNNVYGERLNPSGSLLFMPKRLGVDIFDSHQGRLVLQVGLPDPIPLSLHALVLDETGTRMFLISKTGITIAQLHKVPLSIGTVSPSTGPAGSTITIRGSGFMNGAIVELGDVQASTTFVDLNTLQVIVPALGGDPTAITVVNPDGERYSLQAGFFLAPPKSSIDLQINSGGAGLTTTINGSGSTKSGYAALTLNSGSPPYATAVFSFSQNGVVVSEVGIPSSPPTTDAQIFVDFRTNVAGKTGQEDVSTLTIDTGIAVVNRNGSIANVTYTLRGFDSHLLAQGHGTVAANAHFAKFIDQLSDVAPDFNLPAGFSTLTQFATLEISSSLPLSVLGLRQTTNQRSETLLTSIPVVDMTQLPSSTNVYFPQVADGGGYKMTLILINTSGVAESGTLRFFKDDGGPLTVNQLMGSSGSSFPYNIQAGGFFVFRTDGSPNQINVGSAQVVPNSSTPSPVGAGIFGFAQNGILVTESGVPAAMPTTHARIYVDRSGRHDTGLAIVNPNSSPLLATLTAFQMDGSTLARSSTGNVSLNVNGHVAKFASEFISGLPIDSTGVLDITSLAPFAALTLRELTNERGESLLTTFPIADFNRPAPTPIIFPQIADGGGYRTQFILLSTTGATNATLNFFGDDGSPLAVGKTASR